MQLRQPTFGTNNDPSTWVALGEPVATCRFIDTSGEGATKPVGGQNPSSLLCKDLGGAVDYGATPAGGGLVLDGDENDEILAVCTFADGSFIDEWGIRYYADGTVRGADLSTLFSFDVEKVPAIFPPAS